MTHFLTNLDLSLVQKQRTRDPSMMFPCKLYRMLMDSETQGLTHIVSWHKDGRSFRVHNPQAFVDEVMPKYFKKAKYRSFQRQCNLYGFQRVTAVKPFWDSCYHHPAFVRGETGCCIQLHRPVRGTKKTTAKKRERTEAQDANPSRLPPLDLKTNSTPNNPLAITGKFNPITIPTTSRNVDNDTNLSSETNVEELPTIDIMGVSQSPSESPKRTCVDQKNDEVIMAKQSRRSSYQELFYLILGDVCELNEEEFVQDYIQDID